MMLYIVPMPSKVCTSMIPRTQKNLACSCVSRTRALIQTDETTWQQLKDHMRSAGNVLHADILSGPDGTSKGCAIVQYASFSDAQKAIRDMNDTTLDGRMIFVREDRESGGDRSGGGGSAGRTVFVGNLSWDAKWQDLKVRVQ